MAQTHIEAQAEFFANIPILDRKYISSVHLEDEEDELFWDTYVFSVVKAISIQVITYIKPILIPGKIIIALQQDCRKLSVKNVRKLQLNLISTYFCLTILQPYMSLFFYFYRWTGRI